MANSTSTQLGSTLVTPTQPPPWLAKSPGSTDDTNSGPVQSSTSSVVDASPEAEESPSISPEDDEEPEPEPDSDAAEESLSSSRGEGSSRRASLFSLGGHPTPSRNPRTSEEERVAVLKGDPFVNYFDPQNVQCKNCGKVIKLYGKNYYLKGWNNHREGCIKPDMDANKLPPLPPPTLPIVPKKRLQAKKGPPESRIKELKGDPQVESYDATHITCKYCNRKIGMNTNYNLGAWKAHKSSCKGVPSTLNSSSTTDPPGTVRSRTNEHERIHELENDATVLAFGPDYVVCKLCQQSIKLSGPYYLTTWHRHKYSCREKHSAIKDEILDFNALERKRSYSAAFEYGTPKLRRSLGAGIRPLSAIVATTGLYDWSVMPSYSGNTCPDETADKEKETDDKDDGVMRPAPPAMPPMFKTSNEIAHAMNIAFTKAGLLGGNQQLGSSVVSTSYLQYIQRKVKMADARPTDPHPSGKYPPPAHTGTSASGSQKQMPQAQVVSLANSVHSADKPAGEMVVVEPAGRSPKKRVTMVRTKASSSSAPSGSEAKGKRSRMRVSESSEMTLEGKEHHRQLVEKLNKALRSSSESPIEEPPAKKSTPKINSGPRPGYPPLKVPPLTIINSTFPPDDHEQIMIEFNKILYGKSPDDEPGRSLRTQSSGNGTKGETGSTTSSSRSKAANSVAGASSSKPKATNPAAEASSSKHKSKNEASEASRSKPPKAYKQVSSPGYTEEDNQSSCATQ